METKAHHILVGIFAVLVVVLAVLVTLWMARTSMNRQFHDYDVVFTQPVTGLANGSQVEYNGIRVGQVSRLRLDPNDPRKAVVRIQVGAHTPIKVDTRARLGMLGLTGGTLVQLTGGTPDSKPLLPSTADPVPVIHAEASSLNGLLASGNNVVTELNGILLQVRKITSTQNIRHISHTLANIDTVTSTLADERADLRELVQQANQAAQHLNQALAGANRLVQGPARRSLDSIATTMTSLQEAAHTLNALLASNRDALQSGLQGVDQIGPALRELRHTLHDLRGLTDQLEADPAGFLLGRDKPAQFTPAPSGNH